MQRAVTELGFDFERIIDEEPDAALGNGGLGRLAACFIDSMATLDIAASGHGIKYEYGLFKQAIHDGRQIEQPDDWHSTHSPWLVEHHAQQMLIPIGGRVEHGKDAEETITRCGWIGGFSSGSRTTISFPVIRVCDQ